MGKAIEQSELAGASASPPQTNFCYCCGRRVNLQADRCWFCSSAIHRHIRPPKVCPYCREVVKPKAVKCPHCNEFLDGREPPKPAAQVIAGTFPGGGAGGGGTGPARAGLPDARGPRGIAAPEPAALPPPGRGALPPPRAGLPAPTMDAVDEDEPLPMIGEISGAPPPPPKGRPADDSAIDVELVPAGGGRSSPGRGGLPALRGSGAAGGNLPARAQDAPPKLGHVPGLPILAKAARGLIRLIFSRKEVLEPDYEDVGAVDPETRFRVCENCGTEMMASDNYCFHCGKQHRASPFPTSAPPVPKRSNAFVYVLVAACLALLLLGEPILGLVEGFPEAGIVPASLASGALAILLSAWAFMRKPGVASRMLALLVFLGCLALMYAMAPSLLG